MSLAKEDCVTIPNFITNDTELLRTSLAEALADRVAAHEENDWLRQQLDETRDDLNFVRGERDKLAVELVERELAAVGLVERDSLEELSAFGKELVRLSEYHEDRLEALPPDDEADLVDPFKHQANSYKHGMGIDSFPLVQVEEALFSNDMGSYESWRKIAHAAVLAMSYLSYVANDGGDGCDECDSPEDAA